ncbi:MAG: type II secretion system minor pseudopilin GspH [Gammaproteobacteria bacterium]|nr:type II secretion system minor pseudopilin GspH [Gammaproteobacteria bacterium]
MKAIYKTTGSCKQRRIKGSAGFTLLEILVVVLLIAITASFAVVSLNRDVDRLAQLEARRLVGLIDQLRDESVVSGKSYALEILSDERAYRFLVAAEGWQPITDDSLMRQRVIPEPLSMSYDTPIDAGVGERELVVVQASGQITPFTIVIYGEDKAYHVTLDPAQNIKIQEKMRGEG